MFLGAPLTFYLGGPPHTVGAPWIVNLVPAKEAIQVKTLKPIRFSIRDESTHIDPTTIRVAVGYAKIFSDAGQYFDKEMPSTRRVNLVNGGGSEPNLSLIADGVLVQQATASPERTLYETTLEGGPGYKSIMLTTILRPGLSNADVDASTVEIGTGAVLAIENGPRNKVIYLWFQNDSISGRILRLTSYLTNNAGSPPAINMTVSFDWSRLLRYTILWSEVEGYIEVYADGATDDVQVFRVPITSVPDMPADYYAKVGGTGSLTALYGLVALDQSDSVIIGNVAFTSDVAYPVLGNIRPGEFVTQVVGAELVRTTGAIDPREVTVSSWLDTPVDIMANPDTLARGSSSAGIFRMTKPTIGKTFSLYREDPSLFGSSSEGFMVQARLHVTNTVQQGSATGTGITIFDGQSVFQLQLFQDPGFNTIGLLKKNGSDFDITEYFTPTVPLDWKTGHLFRLVADPRRNVISLYDGDDLNSPVMEIAFDRSKLPSAGDKGWGGATPFIMVGHTLELDTAGTFSLYEVGFCHLYQAWDTNDGNIPTAANPSFTKTSSGGPTDGLTVDGDFQITAPAGALDKFSRAIEFGDHRGGVVEARMKVESWRPLTRTGTYLILDDGLRSFALTFVEDSVGKFVALSQRSGIGAFQEVVGRDGDPALVSFLLDWTQYHTYRMERLPFDGLRVYVDDEVTPRISFPEAKLGQLPDSQYGGTPTLGFGQYSSEGATSRWSYVRGLFSRGYDIAFKKNKPDAVLRTELYKTQALIVAHAQDED